MSDNRAVDPFTQATIWHKETVRAMKENYREVVRGKDKADGLTDLYTVGDRTAERLKENGYTSVMDVAKASTEELEEVKGLGFCRAAQVQEHAILSIPSGDHGSE